MPGRGGPCGIVHDVAPFGGGETGNIPPAGSPAARCEDVEAGALGKALECVLKCHITFAARRLPDETAQEACEAGCEVKFDRKTDASSAIDSICPSCLDTATREGFYDGPEQFMGGSPMTGAIYCACGATP